MADELVFRARTEPEALGDLYAIYYDRIFAFCLHRLFKREAAEDVTSSVFLDVARQMHRFEGQSEDEFRNWLYAIAANEANSYIRKVSRRERLLSEATRLMTNETTEDCQKGQVEITWPMIYSVLSKLKPEAVTIVTLRFFENMDFEQIAGIINAKPGAVRVKLHRILKKLKCHLQSMAERRM